MDSYEHIVDLIIAILIIFLFPLLYFGQKQDALMQMVVSSETKEFIDDVRSKGYLTKEIYDQYLEELSHTGLIYDVSMEHRQLIYEPEYRFRTAEEIIGDQNNAYSGSNIYHYYAVTTNIPTVTDPIDNSGLTMNMETNESVMAGATSTPASQGHVHTDACYDGVKHVHDSNCDRTWVSPPWCTVDERTGTTTHGGCSGGGTVTVYTITTACMGCGASYTYSQVTCSGCDLYDWGGTYFGTCHCGHYVFSCSKTEGKYFDGDTEVYPICNKIITEITPTHPIQAVFTGEELITTATVGYLDGSTKVVLCNTSFSTSSVIRDAIVTLTFTDEFNHVFNTTITVTVIPRTKTCVHGHIYNLNIDGTDPGCIYCRSWLSTLTIQNPSSGNMIIYRGTTLQDNGVVLLATYMDGHTQLLSTEYASNLDKYYIGSQTVTLSYKEKYVSLTVTTKRNIVLCAVCNRYYELYPDDTNPGCPYCEAKTPIFTGNVMEYFDERYEEKILEELYEGSGTYYFTDRDYILITVKNSGGSWSRSLLSNIHNNLGESGIMAIYGGYIRENGRLP